MCFAFAPPNALAQLSVIAPVMVAQPQTILSLPIRCTSRDSINGLQFSLRWNPAVLQYVDITSHGLPGQNLDMNFGRTDTAMGVIRFLWTQSQARNIAIIDTLSLFVLQLRVIGAAGTSSVISISDTPIRAIGTTGADARQIVVQKVDGKVDVLTTSMNNPLARFLFQLYPNPATDFLNVTYDALIAAPITCFCFDPLGRPVFICTQEQTTFRIPVHHWQSGFYMVRLLTHKEQLERTVFISH